MKICLKELRETRVWLLMADRANMLATDRLAPLLNENDQLIAIFVKSIKTAKATSRKTA